MTTTESFKIVRYKRTPEADGSHEMVSQWVNADTGYQLSYPLGATVAARIGLVFSHITLDNAIMRALSFTDTQTALGKADVYDVALLSVSSSYPPAYVDTPFAGNAATAAEIEAAWKDDSPLRRNSHDEPTPDMSPYPYMMTPEVKVESLLVVFTCEADDQDGDFRIIWNIPATVDPIPAEMQTWIKRRHAEVQPL